MRNYHLVIVTALVGAIVACLMVRTPNASATSELSTVVAPQITERPSLLVAQAEPAPEAEAPVVENGAPPNDPVLNEALANEKETPAPAAEEPAKKPAKPLKDTKAFAQTPKAGRDAAAVKSKKLKSKKTAKHPKKKKKSKKA